jgi:hypothetical protein
MNDAARSEAPIRFTFRRHRMIPNMNAPNRMNARIVVLGFGLSLVMAAGGCAPRPPYRPPLPPPVVQAPTPVPAPAPAPEPRPPIQETVRKPVPQDSRIKEQTLPSRGSTASRVPKDALPVPPAAGTPAPPPVPDDSSLLAKITPTTPPQRAASLRLTEEGRKLIDAGAAAKGLPRLEQSLAIDASNPYGYFYLAKAHNKLGRYKESLNFLDVAEARLASEPYWLAEVHALRGENFRALGMAERAEASFSKALSINSGNRTAADAISRQQDTPGLAR